MASYNNAKRQGPQSSYTDERVIYVPSDKYFNDPDSCSMYEDMGFDVRPVDLHGGFVPQNKSLANLKKTEQAIQERFNLEKPE